MRTFYGKYRGKVENNVDPLMQGRVQVSCPPVLGDGKLAWAMPSVPYAGPQVGLFVVPPQNANVWVEFEQGDPNSPILAGCFWGPGEAPASPAVADIKMLKTASISLQLSDVQGGGGLTIEVQPPAVSSPLKIALTAAGIELSNGKSKVMLTTANVDVNDGALQVI
jgi:type VI secretion system (T6SS) baseplate-like injector VgrG